ncbi:MAG TPA: hypothetical protein VNO54_24725, partial [Streptosporangiaceae bacterium]|nr:hypothetical protein [Streptosporangiaceae bacterium]
PSEPLIYRRINGLAGGAGAVGSAPGQQSQHPPLVVAAVVAVMYAAAGLVAVAAVAGLGYGVARMMGAAHGPA